jgi:hypothetical protein
MPAQVAGHVAAARRVADEHNVGQVERLDQLGQMSA